MAVNLTFEPFATLGLLSALSTGFLALGLLRWRNAKLVHRHFAYLLISIGLALTLRVSYDVTKIPFFYGISWVFLALAPMFLSLAFEKTTGRPIPVAEKLLLLGGLVLFGGAGLFQVSPSTEWLIAFGCFHLLVTGTNLYRMIRASAEEPNPVQRNVFRALAFTLSLCIGLLAVDWLSRVSGDQVKPFPIAVIAFTYLLSRIIFSGHLQSLRWELMRVAGLFLLGFLTASLGASEALWESALVFFGLFMLLSQLSNQAFPSSASVAQLLRPGINHSYSDPAEFIEYVSQMPEFTNLCLIEESYLKMIDCKNLDPLFEAGRRIWSLDQANKSSLASCDRQSKDSLQQISYAMMATGSDYLIKIPGSPHYLGYSFVPLINPSVYAGFIRLCSEHLSQCLNSSQTEKKAVV